MISSNRAELIGKSRPIFSEKQLGRIDCMINQKSFDSPQIQALVDPNGISEEDVFWDNFWLFKKKEEEKRMKKEEDDSDEEHKEPMKLGDYMKNPSVLFTLAFRKNFKKLRRNLIFINSIGGISIMSLLFLVQVRYSPKFRKYSKNLIHFGLFAFTILGFGASIALLYKGLKAKLTRKKGKDNENEDSKMEDAVPDQNIEGLVKAPLPIIACK